MLEFTNADAAESLQSAGKLNSAVKNFLRNEIQKGDPAGKFAKQLRELAGKSDPENLTKFLEKHGEKYSEVLFVLTRYAFQDQVSQVAEVLVTEYAEKFNETYESSASGITITNEPEFRSLTKEILSEMEKLMKEQELPVNSFMKNVLIMWIFEEGVAEEVVATLSGS